MIKKLINNRYKIDEKIGIGGMGVVYKVKDILLNRLAALKTMKIDNPNQYQIDRFKKEIEILKELDHRNIVSIYDSGQIDNQIYYYVMEYVEGENLRQYFSKEINFAQVYHFMNEICKALKYIHDKGIIHRDIKPDNIMVCKINKNIKLMDFGTVKINGTETITVEGTIIGTPHFMSKQQALGKEPSIYDDIYGRM